VVHHEQGLAGDLVVDHLVPHQKAQGVGARLTRSHHADHQVGGDQLGGAALLALGVHALGTPDRWQRQRVGAVPGHAGGHQLAPRQRKKSHVEPVACNGTAITLPGSSAGRGEVQQPR
jgi:hypothetical protein